MLRGRLSLLHLGGVGDGLELRVSGASHGCPAMKLACGILGGKRKKKKSESVRSLRGADDRAVEVNIEIDFVALAVGEGVGSVEGGLDGRSDGVLDAGGGGVSKYGLLVSFLCD